MGIDDLVKQAKAAVSGREEQAKDALDKAAEAVKSRTGDRQDAQIDSVVEKAKTYLDEQQKK
ncbi:antitoxin [Cellulomonas fengjieae]|uniref:Antitoxin n=1 Tax=Cellulomonas fengjieae TaxID=2819978 RepID=A0ABS3SIY2_9CELL|nr:antitoxin [Cellulomonas fengjieae]MBO3085279.1 antitoxin [Cellulomonas fengjieae]MBO3101025.1 antitoxin [Cellulomonas fengjieae]QVI66160.1 antitoxin [Cellulomonas fengjieae]